MQRELLAGGRGGLAIARYLQKDYSPVPHWPGITARMFGSPRHSRGAACRPFRWAPRRYSATLALVTVTPGHGGTGATLATRSTLRPADHFRHEEFHGGKNLGEAVAAVEVDLEGVHANILAKQTKVGGDLFGGALADGARCGDRVTGDGGEENTEAHARLRHVCSAKAVAGGRQSQLPCFQVREGHRRGLPDRREFGGSSERRRACAANPDGWATGLERLRLHVHIGEGVELPLERDGVGAPTRLEDAQVFIGAGAAFVEGDAEGSELRFVPARPDASDHAATGHSVQRRVGLGCRDGVAIGDDEDRCAEAYARRARGHERERDEGVEGIAPGAEVARRAVDDDVVVDHDGIEAERFRGDRRLDDAIRRRLEAEIVRVGQPCRKLDHRSFPLFRPVRS